MPSPIVHDALVRATALGHHLQSPMPIRKNGKRLYIYGCDNCTATLLATEYAALGDATTVPCVTTPTPSAPVLNVPATIRPCEYCGNGSTLVGKSCRNCAQARSLTEPQPRKYRPTQGLLDEHPGAPIWPATRCHHHRPYRYALTEQGQPTFLAPCGATPLYRAIYFPTDEKLSPNTTALIVYGCSCNCATLDYLDGLTPEEFQHAARAPFERQNDPILNNFVAQILALLYYVQWATGRLSRNP